MDPDQPGSLSLEVWLLVAVVATAQGMGLHPPPPAVGDSNAIGAAWSLARPGGSSSPGWLKAWAADAGLSATATSGLARVIEAGSRRRNDSRAARIARPSPMPWSATIR